MTKKKKSLNNFIHGKTFVQPISSTVYQIKQEDCEKTFYTTQKVDQTHMQ